MMNVAAARGEMGKTKEQLAEDKKIALSFRVKPLEIEGLSNDELKSKAKEMWEAIIKLETEKYDLEERQKRQEYDVSRKYFLKRIVRNSFGGDSHKFT